MEKGLDPAVVAFLNWIEQGALAGNFIFLLGILFYTQHKGLTYVITYAIFIVLCGGWLATVVLNPPPILARPDDKIRPLVILAWACVSFGRLRHLHRQSKLDEAEKTALAAHHIFEVTLFTLNWEKTQKLAIITVASIFFLGIFSVNLERIQILYSAAALSSQKTGQAMERVEDRLDGVEKAVETDTAFQKQVLANQESVLDHVTSLSASSPNTPLRTKPKARPRQTKQSAGIPTPKPIKRKTAPNRSPAAPDLQNSPSKEEKNKWWPWNWFSTIKGIPTDSTTTLVKTHFY